jgi:hypothetical protein
MCNPVAIFKHSQQFGFADSIVVTPSQVEHSDVRKSQGKLEYLTETSDEAIGVNCR